MNKIEAIALIDRVILEYANKSNDAENGALWKEIFTRLELMKAALKSRRITLFSEKPRINLDSQLGVLAELDIDYPDSLDHLSDFYQKWLLPSLTSDDIAKLDIKL